VEVKYLLKINEDKSNNKMLFKTTSLLIDVWSEKSRYDIQPKNSKDVQDAIELLKNENGLLSWILKN
jgi:hypothetical protein